MEGTKPEDASVRYGTIGRLAIYVVRDASTWHGGIEEGDRYLLDFTGSDWDALFYDVFNCPRPERYVDGEDIDAYDASNRARLQQSIPEYPMLGRIWDLYADVSYQPEEINELKNECVKVHSLSDQPRALKAVNKLLLACEEARKDRRGLFLVSD